MRKCIKFQKELLITYNKNIKVHGFVHWVGNLQLMLCINLGSTYELVLKITIYLFLKLKLLRRRKKYREKIQHPREMMNS